MRAVLSSRWPTPWVALAVLVTLAACAEPAGTPTAPDLGKAATGPTVSSTNPPEAPRDTTLDVTVLGSGFDAGSRVDFLLNGAADAKVRTNATRYVSPRELVANITIDATAALGLWDVQVTTSTGKKGIGTELFKVVSYEVLGGSASGGANVNRVSDNGLIVGTVATSCGNGYAPALWDQAGQLTNLPALPGTCGGAAWGVNASGIVVGFVTGATITEVRWVPTATGYAVFELPRLPNGRYADPWAVNASGLVVGHSAAVWSESTGWQMLPWPTSASTCVSHAINDQGAVGGSCTVSGQPVAVYWASVSSVPELLPSPAGASFLTVEGMNDAGVMVGFAQVSDIPMALRWTLSGGAWSMERLSDLGAGGDARDVNESGQAVGSVRPSKGTGYPRPALWSASGVLEILDTKDGVGEVAGVSDAGNGPTVMGGYIRTGKGGGTRLAVRWLR